mmetsp:Transcript_60623/g.161873  ORF Transcript_60623/g.161873 Transcript_60623/m.161873 type:complete len:102 (+) Transcript_60623:576-881(+)
MGPIQRIPRLERLRDTGMKLPEISKSRSKGELLRAEDSSFPIHPSCSRAPLSMNAENPKNYRARNLREPVQTGSPTGTRACPGVWKLGAFPNGDTSFVNLW